MKKGLAYFFLVIFLYNSMGNYLVFELNRFVAKQEMQSFIRSRKLTSQLMVLKVFQPEHSADFQRIEAGEISFKGRLYDIVKETTKDGITTFYCIQDIREEILIAGFQHAQQRKITTVLLHNLVTQALPVVIKPGTEPTATDVLFADKTDPISPIYPALAGHPPELA